MHDEEYSYGIPKVRADALERERLRMEEWEARKQEEFDRRMEKAAFIARVSLLIASAGAVISAVLSTILLLKI